MSRIENELPLQFIGDEDLLSADDLLDLSGVQHDELSALVEQGTFGIDMHRMVVTEWRFTGSTARVLRRAIDLRNAFELEHTATSVLFGLLERIEDLQRHVRELECHRLGDGRDDHGDDSGGEPRR